jgi:hypothetical protein
MNDKPDKGDRTRKEYEANVAMRLGRQYFDPSIAMLMNAKNRHTYLLDRLDDKLHEAYHERHPRRRWWALDEAMRIARFIRTLGEETS